MTPKQTFKIKREVREILCKIHEFEFVKRLIPKPNEVVLISLKSILDQITFRNDWKLTFCINTEAINEEQTIIYIKFKDLIDNERIDIKIINQKKDKV